MARHAPPVITAWTFAEYQQSHSKGETGCDSQPDQRNKTNIRSVWWRIGRNSEQHNMGDFQEVVHVIFFERAARAGQVAIGLFSRTWPSPQTRKLNHIACTPIVDGAVITHPLAPKECLTAESTRVPIGVSDTEANVSNAAMDKTLATTSTDGRVRA